MLLGDELRAAIQEAYAHSRAQQAAEDPPVTIPAWETLSLGMRIAIINVYAAGCQLGAEEERQRDLPPGDGGARG
jgi:hypothetical protein